MPPTGARTVKVVDSGHRVLTLLVAAATLHSPYRFCLYLRTRSNPLVSQTIYESHTYNRNAYLRAVYLNRARNEQTDASAKKLHVTHFTREECRFTVQDETLIRTRNHENLQCAVQKELRTSGGTRQRPALWLSLNSTYTSRSDFSREGNVLPMFYLARWGRGDGRFEKFLRGELKIDIEEPIDKVRRVSGRFEDGRERRARFRDLLLGRLAFASTFLKCGIIGGNSFFICGARGGHLAFQNENVVEIGGLPVVGFQRRRKGNHGVFLVTAGLLTNALPKSRRLSNGRKHKRQSVTMALANEATKRKIASDDRKHAYRFGTTSRIFNRERYPVADPSNSLKNNCRVSKDSALHLDLQVLPTSNHSFQRLSSSTMDFQNLET
ncbi:hypothetical protein B0H14DRAFT_2628051 [Mycena olivaceomarginata]|nr:hypothetical protein B0H14DRAFT_2628051 [Mycena olivaceomarginata]